jgi:hypothetical protein
MKRLPLILGLIFISVTVHRVALFSGGGFNGWAVALALAIGVFLSAYFSEMKTTSKPALVALIAFVVVDGLFNVSEVLKWSVEQGRWDFALKFSEETSIYIYRFADPLYGIFPTLAAAMLGWLSKSAEKLIVSRKGSWKDRLANGLVNWFLGTLPEGESGQKTTAEKLPETFRAPSDLPPWLPQVPGSLKEFKYMIDEGIIILPPGLTGADLQAHIPSVGTDRTGRNWLIGVGYRDLESNANGAHQEAR